MNIPSSTTPPHPFVAGLLCRCPKCGKAPLFAGLLAVRDQCEQCGLNLEARDPGDGPAFFVITILGVLVVALAVWVEFTFEPPLWVHAVLWIPFILIGSVLMLRVFKSLLVAYQYHHRIGLMTPEASKLKSQTREWLLLAGIVAILLSLGVWQLFRLEEKEAMLAGFERAQHSPPMEITEITAANAPKREYQHVALHGQWLHDKELFLGGRSYGRETGYEILTPYQTDAGKIVLVNRGFVPTNWKKPADRPKDIWPVQASITGQLREPRLGGMFTPDNHPEENFWFTVDVPAMEKATGLTLEPYYVEMVDPKAKWGLFPLPGDAKLHVRNDHLGYAITWFGLAMAAIAVFGTFLRKRGRNAGL